MPFLVNFDMSYSIISFHFQRITSVKNQTNLGLWFCSRIHYMCIKVIQGRFCHETLSLPNPVFTFACYLCLCSSSQTSLSFQPSNACIPCPSGCWLSKGFFSSSFQTQVLLNRVWIIHILVADSGPLKAKLSAEVLYSCWTLLHPGQC